ncbi:MAG: transporter substrate-binding domain-containing protein [Alphaproteobacteria bacterium]|nr:transporter substrate-binding domain-containing protein [Alphaproteobacteria bacterium]
MAKYIAAIIILCIGVAAGQLLLQEHGTQGTARNIETAYERVMRTGTLRCAYALWAPFFQKDANTGKLSGFNYDIFMEIGKELGLKIEWAEEVGFGNYIEGLNTGRYDAMCQTVWPDPGRFTKATVTLPAHYHKVYVVVRADDNRFDNGYARLNDPSFKTVAIEGDITETIARTDFPQAKLVSLPQAADASQLFMEIAAGKADATFVDWGFFKSYDEANPGKLKTAGKVLRVYGSVFSVKLGDLDLKALFDNAIIALTNNGKIAEILQRFPTTAMPPAPTYAAPAADAASAN